MVEIFIRDNEKTISKKKIEGYHKYAELIQWGRKNPVKFIEHFLKIELLDVQKYIIMGTWNTPNNLWLITRNGGKALALDTRIPTPNGDKFMKDIKVGDYVFDENRNPTKVKFTSDIFYNHDCYKLIFDDNESITADANHIWRVRINNSNKLINITTEEIFNKFNDHFYIPKVKNSGYKEIIAIKKVNSVPTKCIGVESPSHLFLCGERNTVTHNSTMTAPFIMAKGILYPNHNTYLLSNVSAQSQDTFLKIEKIAKKEISSFTGLNDFFANELVKSAANTDGFTHSQSGYNYKLYNGSQTTSLSGDINNNRGKRSNLNVYDESGWTSEEYIVNTIPFLLQNSTFKLGGDSDIQTFPKQVPNQRLFISSASDTSSYFYSLYKDYSKQMMLGNKDYFVADINADVIMKATFNGKVYPVSLIDRSTIDAEMRKNKEKALREFYNKFSVDGGDNQVFKRARIINNSHVRLPVIKNNSTEKRRFVLAYDPAHDYDNSVCLVGEIIEDPIVGYKMDIVSGVSFVDISKRLKTPMRTPEQIKELKKMILNYNGEKKADYENIECLMIDSGAGGGGNLIGDYLMEDWEDENGIKHKGLIDKIESAEHVHKFPNAVDKVKLLSPKKYKVEMFDALLEMLNLDLISFTSEYDMTGHLIVPVESKKDIEVEYEDDNGNIQTRKEKEISHKKFNLDFEQELALKNIDLAKEELANIYQYNNNGVRKYSLSKDKESTMHDDRAYCLAMLGWYLQQLRRENIINKPREEIDLFRIPTQVSSLNITL